MKVTVIITTFQRTDYLIRAIDSVLASDYENFEVLVIDDNGLNSDFQLRNIEILRKYSNVKNFKYYAMLLNSGACKARNKGGELTNGEILMFLDDDDYYFENKISKHIEPLINSDFDACLCAMKRMNTNNEEIFSNENFPRGEHLKSFILNGNCFTSMIAIKKSSFIKINGFSEIDRFQDEFFMCKFFENNLKVFLLQEQLFVFSEHSQARISIGNIEKILNAYKEIFDFKKKHFNLFSKKEQENLTYKYNFNQAYFRSSGNILQRLKGLNFLIKSKSFSRNKNLLFKLIFSDTFVNMIKNKIYKS